METIGQLRQKAFAGDAEAKKRFEMHLRRMEEMVSLNEPVLIFWNDFFEKLEHLQKAIPEMAETFLDMDFGTFKNWQKRAREMAKNPHGFSEELAAERSKFEMEKRQSLREIVKAWQELRSTNDDRLLRAVAETRKKNGKPNYEKAAKTLGISAKTVKRKLLPCQK